MDYGERRRQALRTAGVTVPVLTPETVVGAPLGPCRTDEALRAGEVIPTVGAPRRQVRPQRRVPVST
ncbi:hypothetical protein ABZ638_35915 [Streptomyces sp. NPDC007107]|uniref:hypothetical protein n=1 Tax=Streptomyces sp. NPDC007107 TaxID=3156915 RepID=UPI0033F8B215